MKLEDYQGFMGDQNAGMELLKAMQAGQITGRDAANQVLGYEPLKLESLDHTLKVLEFRQKDIRLLNLMPKQTAYNTVEEYLQLTSYGTNRGGFYNEGELSDVEDSQYMRRAEHIKYIQVTGEVTLQAQMVKSVVDAMRQETENKVMWVTRRANIALTKGDSDIIPQEFNSLYKQHASIGTGSEFLYANPAEYYASDVVIDLRGKSLKQHNVEEAATRIDGHFGGVSDVFAPTKVLSALSQDYFRQQRILMNGSTTERAGVVIKKIDTTIGEVNLQADKYIATDPSRTSASGATSQKAPSAPTSVGRTLVADTAAAFTADDAGAVYYAVSAVNRFGESNLTVIGAAVTLAANFAVDLEFTSGGGAVPASGYTIYRTKVTAAGSAAGLAFYPLYSVSVSQLSSGYDGSSAGSIRDRGRIMPDMETAFITEMTEEVLCFKQLAPISKLDLAVVSLSNRFITFLFATPQLNAPLKMVKFVNVNRSLTIEA